MASMLDKVSESDEEDYHSLSANTESRQNSQTHAAGDDTVDTSDAMQAPVHPVPSMQNAFEESFLESADDNGARRTLESADAEARRTKLLETKRYDESWRIRWRQNPTAQHHPLVKLMAQIVFGMHLLQQQQAKSNEEVVRILQNHVTEFDSFLERTAEDFDLAIADIEERVLHLQLPMEHLLVFKVMLEDKPFRTTLLDGNAKIEKIIERTSKSMNAALDDISEGVRASQGLARYLEASADLWPRNKPDIVAVFVAMRGNHQGWKQYLASLREKAKALGSSLVVLGSVIIEMSKLAAGVSNRNRPASVSQTRQSASSGIHSKFSHSREDSSLNKPLPTAPGHVGTLERILPVPFASRFERPRAQPPPPTPESPTFSTAEGDDRLDNVHTHPRTAGTEPKVSRSSSKTGNPEIDEYLDNGGPLRSHPPHRSVSSKADNGADMSRPRPQSSRDDQLVQSNGHIVLNRLHAKQEHDQAIRPSSGGCEKPSSIRSVLGAQNQKLPGPSFARRFSQRLNPVNDANSTLTIPTTSPSSDFFLDFRLDFTPHEEEEAPNKPVDSVISPTTASSRPNSRLGPIQPFSPTTASRRTSTPSVTSSHSNPSKSGKGGNAQTLRASSRITGSHSQNPHRASTSLRLSDSVRSRPLSIRNIFSSSNRKQKGQDVLAS